MLPPADSPMHQLISTWWHKSRPPYRHELAAARVFLWTAATREIQAHAAAGTFYDPLTDYRFQWASQWLDLAAGNRKTICPNVTTIAAVFFDPPVPLSRKDIAAGS